MTRKRFSWLTFGSGTLIGWIVSQHVRIGWQLQQKDTQQTLAQQINQGTPGLQIVAESETEAFTRQHVIADGIERISYFPKQRRFQTPLVLQHGMWHGAWCWQEWQEQLAAWGWESHAHSLPGHAGSPPQRPISLCTLDYYLAFLKMEMDRLPQPPVLLGHSMGGALIQWYLRYVRDLPAAVLVAPWVSHSLIKDGLWGMMKLDPLFLPLALKELSATPLVRNPYRAARALISEQAQVSPITLFSKLGPESLLVMYQHNPPFWQPPSQVGTPLLWLAGTEDALLNERVERRSAAFYSADYVTIPGAGHNIMMEPQQGKTVAQIHEWLVAQGIQ